MRPPDRPPRPARAGPASTRARPSANASMIMHPKSCRHLSNPRTADFARLKAAHVHRGQLGDHFTRMLARNGKDSPCIGDILGHKVLAFQRFVKLFDSAVRLVMRDHNKHFVRAHPRQTALAVDNTAALARHINATDGLQRSLHLAGGQITPKADHPAQARFFYPCNPLKGRASKGASHIRHFASPLQGHRKPRSQSWRYRFSRLFRGSPQSRPCARGPCGSGP